MAFDIKIKGPQIPVGMIEFRTNLLNAVVKRVNRSTIMLRIVFVKASPVGATGLLRAAWNNVPARVESNKVIGSVINPTVQANVVEKGARRHTPPRQNLELWVRRKLNVNDDDAIRDIAVGIQKKFTRRRRPGRKIFRFWFNRMTPEIEDEMVKAQMEVRKIIEESPRVDLENGV